MADLGSAVVEYGDEAEWNPSKARAPLMYSRYICVMVVFESIHGLNAMVTYW